MTTINITFELPAHFTADGDISTDLLEQLGDIVRDITERGLVTEEGLEVREATEDEVDEATESVMVQELETLPVVVRADRLERHLTGADGGIIGFVRDFFLLGDFSLSEAVVATIATVSTEFVHCRPGSRRRALRAALVELSTITAESFVEECAADMASSVDERDWEYLDTADREMYRVRVRNLVGSRLA